MEYINTWKLRNGVEIRETHFCGDLSFIVTVDDTFITAVYPDTPQRTNEMRDALDWAVKHGYSVGRVIEKALNRMEGIR